MLLPLILASSALAQEPVYPEGAEIPASLTPAERAWLAENPLLPPARTPGLSAAPPTEVWCPPEYAPMDGILIAWEGSNSWKDILADMAREITTIGDADVHVMVDTTSERSSATTTLQNNGVNMSRVIFHVVTTDSIWIRDYGPRYIYQGQVRSVVDHVYNRPRPQDDMQPVYFADALGHARYDIPLVHGGGNFHLDGQDTGYTTRLINDENPGLTEQEIADLWREFQGLDMVFFDPYSAFIDSTQHLDMWMQVVADDVVVISDWVNDQGSTQDLICEAAAFEMQARGFTVLRTPARRVFGTHYTYTNVVMCNDLVLIPSYSNGTISQYNAQALATWQQACPGKTIVPIDAQAIVTSAGVLHCIVMHLPAHLGGADLVGLPVGEELVLLCDFAWQDSGGRRWQELTVPALASGERRTVVFRDSGSRPTLNFLVLDPQGEPLADTELWGEFQRKVRHISRLPDTPRLRTDADGRFRWTLDQGPMSTTTQELQGRSFRIYHDLVDPPARWQATVDLSRDFDASPAEDLVVRLRDLPLTAGGWVRRPDGSRLANVTVELRGTPPDEVVDGVTHIMSERRLAATSTVRSGSDCGRLTLPTRMPPGSSMRSCWSLPRRTSIVASSPERPRASSSSAATGRRARMETDRGDRPIVGRSPRWEVAAVA